MPAAPIRTPAYNAQLVLTMPPDGATEVYQRAEVDAYITQLHDYVENLKAQISAMAAELDSAGVIERRTPRSDWEPGQGVSRAHDLAEQAVTDLTADAEAAFFRARSEAERLLDSARSSAESLLASARREAGRLAAEAGDRAVTTATPMDSATGWPWQVADFPWDEGSEPSLDPLAGAVSEPVPRALPVPVAPRVEAPWWVDAVVSWPPSMPASVPWARAANGVTGPWAETHFDRAALAAEAPGSPRATLVGVGWAPAGPAASSDAETVEDTDGMWGPPRGPMFAPPTGPPVIPAGEQTDQEAGADTVARRRRLFKR